MNTFNEQNLTHIKGIFQEKTGVEVSSSRPLHRPVRTALVLAAVVCCLAVTAFGYSLFSDLEGDDLALRAAYEGGGIVVIEVENRSEKVLRFQEQLKLMRWRTGEELEARGDVSFSGTEIAPGETGTMRVDLSGAYDVAALEQPLTDDWYYLVLTNNNFLFGQDWMCSVEFAETVRTPVEELPPARADEETVANIAESLRPYFEDITFDPAQRRALTEQYVTDYTALLEEFDGNIVPSVSPVLPGNRLDLEAPRLTVADTEYSVSCNWFSVDANFKLLAAEGEYAYVISAELPSQRYGGDGNAIPLLYLMTYEKAALTGDDYAFIYGQVVPLAELAQHKVYEDEERICYEVSPFVYSDLEEYVDDQAERDPDILLDDAARQQVEDIRSYYRENLGSLIRYK